MTWLLLAGAVLIVVLVALVANELRVQRRRRALLRLPSALAFTIPPRRPVDVIELDWSADPDRSRLGRLGQ